MLTLLLAAPLLAAPPQLRHHLEVALEPAAHRITVEDTIRWPQDVAAPSFPGLEKAFPGAAIDRGAPGALTIRYTRTIEAAPREGGAAYGRGMAETSGTIGPEGVFLGGGSGWYPEAAGNPLVVFDLEVSLPAGWDAMSQGRRTVHERSEAGTKVRFVSDDPQEEIWLVAGPWVETRKESDGIELIAMLRTKDDALAGKYLDAAGPYLAMYSGMFGPHAYPKWALVENFWETGYGMPSFTLLGSSVIRLPFIVNTSYPHEILHDWWGNGVYVDRASGNWCEGLTAYLADHLLQEQKGGGTSYRQETLQKYGDYVLRSKDFPLSEFRERHSAATEAVGYGKALMVFHMLRRELGDQAFVAALRSFYAAQKFRRASWDDLGVASGHGPWIDRWVGSAGAPSLAVKNVVVAGVGIGGYSLKGRIVQTQEGEAFPLVVPIAVTLEGTAQAQQMTVRCEAKSCEFSLKTEARPLRIDVDPEFDVFRTLDRGETPPALSTAFGASGGLVVLPSGASAEMVDAYRAMFAGWAGDDAKPPAFTTDAETKRLPQGVPVWVVGWENKLVPEVRSLLLPYDANLSVASFQLPAGALIARNKHAVAVVARRDDRPDLTVAFVAADTPAQVPGLARKLPHYHKYSYLVFEGDEPTNTHKGRWPALGSPLTMTIEAGAKPSDVPAGKRAPREALAELPPAFSEERMMATVRALAAAEMNGRGLGTPELDRAADAIVAAMKDAGLAPAGDDGTYFQSWDGMRNVLGVIPGARADWKREMVVVSAHYDHLGAGHPGADDNASGVAVLLELARAMAASGAPSRSIVFAAFTGEESGLVGSKRFVATYPQGRTITAAVNLDAVGRYNEGGLMVLGCGTASEWIHVASGAGYVTGAAVKGVTDDPGGSDQKSFVEAKIPAVQLFTGAHADYHKPTDTTDRVDGPGLVKVAAVAREFVAFLAERDRPLTATFTSGAVPSGPPGRKASLGTVPDYAFEGPGVRIEGTTPGSPAEAAGLTKGDVLVAIDGVRFAGMREYAACLASHAPGDAVRLTFLRNGEERTVEARLAAR